MTKLFLQKVRDRVKKYSEDESCINGYQLDLDTQYKIVFEHFRLANIGFGVLHEFWDLGESIFYYWFETLQSNKDKSIPIDKSTLREKISEEMKSEPTDENMKVRIDIKKLLGEKIRFIDLFAGIGGFHQAMHSVGARCVFASEWDKNARISYEANYKDI